MKTALLCLGIASIGHVAVTLVASLCLAAAAMAQGTGTINGVVTERTSGGYLVGAEVRVAVTEIVGATSRDGRFTLSMPRARFQDSPPHCALAITLSR